jgi:WD40 repeat protein
MSKRNANQGVDDEQADASSSSSSSRVDEPDAKRLRGELTTVSDVQTLATTVNLRNASLVLSDRASRPSTLSAPELQLTGHEGAVYSIDFDPTGQHLASCSMDQKICKFSCSLSPSFSPTVRCADYAPLSMYT